MLLRPLAALLALASCLALAQAWPRTQYHEQGVHGPKSYKFGFSGGDHSNPLERHEVSDGQGHVRGWYSYLDAAGHHQLVHYEAHPKLGFRVYLPKSQLPANNGKRSYNT